MIKVILFVIAVVLILYLGLRKNAMDNVSHPAQTEQRVQQDIVPEPEEKEQETTKTQIVQKQSQKPSASKAMPIPSGQSQEKYTASRERDGDENTNEDEEAEDETPSVERSRLIGGADVEWIEPKPKDPDNKFGEPPM